MAITQADIDNLERAISTGNLTVEIEGKKVTKRSVGELKDALRYAREQLAAQSGRVPVTQSYMAYSRE